MKTFTGVCLKLLLLLCLFFFAAQAADKGWPEFNPKDSKCVAFYYKQAVSLCDEMKTYQETYFLHGSDLASSTATNPFHEYEQLWMPVWRAYSKDPGNRERESKLSPKTFEDAFIPKLAKKRAILKESGNPPFTRKMVQEVMVGMLPHCESPIKVRTSSGKENTWLLPVTIPGTCVESPEKGIPTRKTPYKKNSNMVRLGLGMAPGVFEAPPNKKAKYRHCNAHHMGQKPEDETIVFLLSSVHKGHSGVLHGHVKASKIKRQEFGRERQFVSKVLAARRIRKWLFRLSEALELSKVS